MIDFSLFQHLDRLNEWQVDFIGTRRKWERWRQGGPTTLMFNKLVEAFLDCGGEPIEKIYSYRRGTQCSEHACAN